MRSGWGLLVITGPSVKLVEITVTVGVMVGCVKDLKIRAAVLKRLAEIVVAGVQDANSSLCQSTTKTSD